MENRRLAIRQHNDKYVAQLEAAYDEQLAKFTETYDSVDGTFVYE